MTKKDLFKLAVGVYELVDNIGNYYYTMEVNIADSGERIYIIREKGIISRERIFMIENYVNEEDGCTFREGDIKYKTLTAISGVGGLRIHSNDTFNMLSELKFVPRGSFDKFIKNTKQFEKNNC